MGLFSNLKNYCSIAAGLRDYSRQPAVLNPMELVRRQVETREESWLALVEQAVFANDENPYTRMFALADCTFGDLRQSVKSHGLEATLEKLCDSGVYLTADEFKGKAPIVRDGQEIPSAPGVFHNRLEGSWLEVASGGSSGKPTRLPYSTGSLVTRDIVSALAIGEFNLQDYARLIVRPVLPSAIGVMMGLSMSRMGCPMDRWFATGGSAADSFHYRALTRYLVHVGRLHGATVPAPEYLAQGDFAAPIEWIAREKANGRQTMLSAFVSPAVRMAALAMERGLDVQGTIVVAGGETVTDAKLTVLKHAGMRLSARYWISEIGPVGMGCSNMLNEGRVHLMRHAVAVISRPRLEPIAQTSVQGLHFTSVSPLCTSVLINAEMGDTAVLERTDCDCTLGRAGLNWEIRDIASYSKLTGQGMTLMGTDIVALLEERLPSKFGGGPADYQLVQFQAEGQTELELRVSPRVGVGNVADVKREFTSALRGVYGGSLATRVWEHSDGLKVVEREPFATPTGKVLPLHLAGGTAENRGAHES